MDIHLTEAIRHLEDGYRSACPYQELLARIGAVCAETGKYSIPLDFVHIYPWMMATVKCQIDRSVIRKKTTDYIIQKTTLLEVYALKMLLNNNFDDRLFVYLGALRHIKKYSNIGTHREDALLKIFSNSDTDTTLISWISSFYNSH